MPTRTQRHAAIIRLVRSREVTSQEALRALLAEEGIEVTQATLSRDIRALGLVKSATDDGRPLYTVPADVLDPTPTLSRLLPALYVGGEGVGHLLVLNTLTGGAQPVAVALDQQEWDDILGTIAGDDTILVILRSEEARTRVLRRIEELAGVDAG